MTIIGEPRSFHNKFRFQLEIDDLGRAAFQSCSELKVEAQKIEYYEGGMLIPYKEPGKLAYSDLTLDRACTASLDMYDWMIQVADAVKQSGYTNGRFKRTGTIVQYDRDDTRLRTWNLTGLWPLSYTAGAWDNNSDEFTMEQVVLAYDYFTWGTNITTGGRPVNILGAGLTAIRKAF